ncbi:hypothetical protein D1007_42345 [Hordeum vulgare]|nr:hypothetical protein D1007_42345 [Hordeum vulgare]
MAKASKVSPTLNPNISLDDDDDDYDNEDYDNDEECYNILSLKLKGEMIFKGLYKNKLACSNFMEIMYVAIEGKKYIEELEAHLEEHEATIETMEGHGRDYAHEIAELSKALENEQTTKESLEETFSLELFRFPVIELSSTCVHSNHIEEIKDVKVQVTSIKKDLEKSQEGMSTLNNVLCGQKSPIDKVGLGFNSNKKNKSKSFKKKGQEQVKNSTKIVCFKCTIEGHHVRSCPLKKKPPSHKQQGKWPQVQSHTQLQVEERPLPKETQVNTPQGEKSIEKKVKGRCCYLCRENGHFAASCTRGSMLALEVSFACVLAVKMMLDIFAIYQRELFPNTSCPLTSGTPFMW